MYFKFKVPKLKEMVKIKIAKFSFSNFHFRFKNKMLSLSFDYYFTNLSEVHKFNPRQKAKMDIIIIYLIANLGGNDLIMSA